MIRRKGLIEKQLLGGIDALERLMTTTLPKWMFASKLIFKSTLLLNG